MNNRPILTNHSALIRPSRNQITQDDAQREGYHFAGFPQQLHFGNQFAATIHRANRIKRSLRRECPAGAEAAVELTGADVVEAGTIVG